MVAAALANAPPVTPTPACAAWCFCQLWLTRAALLACTGTIGHVAHGKSTVVKAISGVHTVRFKNELERNITIKLGYANAKIYKCHDPECPRPGNFLTRGSSTEDSVKQGKWTYELVRHVSFVDCPGHDILMATMLNGAAVMDAALLLIAGNEPCPQPQTSEHLAAVEIMKLQHIIILQNKIDLVKEAAALQQHEDIKAFVKGTVADSSPIIPISAQLRYNIDVAAEYITNSIPVPIRDFTSEPKMIVIRSFDVNKPGQEVQDLRGGVAGGSILQGVLKLGQEIEIRPGTLGAPLRPPPYAHAATCARAAPQRERGMDAGTAAREEHSSVTHSTRPRGNARPMRTHLGELRHRRAQHISTRRCWLARCIRAHSRPRHQPTCPPRPPPPHRPPPPYPRLRPCRAAPQASSRAARTAA